MGVPMPDASSQFDRQPSRDHSSTDIRISKRWPLRLVISLIGLPIFVACAIPAVQASRSTSVYDRTIGAMDSLIPFIPAIVILAAVPVSVLRSRHSRVTKQVAWVMLIASLSSSWWLCRELLHGWMRDF